MAQIDTERDHTGSSQAPLRLSLGELPARIEPTVWTAGETFASAEPDQALLVVLAKALRVQNLEVAGRALLIRHQTGDRGLPVAKTDGELGFSLDLSDGNRPIDGGLLLFVDQGGRVAGWRPQRGALTIWSGIEPELTELIPGAPERIGLFGRLRRVENAPRA